jgi:hypothetical protein
MAQQADGLEDQLDQGYIIDTLADLVIRSVAAQRAAAEADLATIPGQLADLSRRFVTLDRRLPAAVRRLEQLRARSAANDFAAAELERLHAAPGVRGVQVSGRVLQVETEPIVIAWGDRQRDLGAYCLVLDLDGDVRVTALGGRGPKSHWDHPHVQDGLPCLGNLREGVLKLIAEYELALATQVLLDFLGTYVPETAYTPIEGWPEV